MELQKNLMSQVTLLAFVTGGVLQCWSLSLHSAASHQIAVLDHGVFCRYCHSSAPAKVDAAAAKQ